MAASASSSASSAEAAAAAAAAASATKALSNDGALPAGQPRSAAAAAAATLGLMAGVSAILFSMRPAASRTSAMLAWLTTAATAASMPPAAATRHLRPVLNRTRDSQQRSAATVLDGGNACKRLHGGHNHLNAARSCHL